LEVYMQILNPMGVVSDNPDGLDKRGRFHVAQGQGDREVSPPERARSPRDRRIAPPGRLCWIWWSTKMGWQTLYGTTHERHPRAQRKCGHSLSIAQRCRRKFPTADAPWDRGWYSNRFGRRSFGVRGPSRRRPLSGSLLPQ
jgi:hypothetical protein